VRLDETGTSRMAVVMLALIVASTLAACVPVVVVGAAGGAALVATDRRTAGAQVDDEGVELKVVTQAENLYGDRAHVNVTSYNGLVLLTGEVPDQGAWASIGNFAKAQQKVKSVQNELVVAPPTNLSQRSNDTYITSKVKARFVEANRFPPNAVKVVTERGVVYLMGIVSKAEGDSAGDVAASTDGVAKVVKVFEYR
jgi:osmotically-inducible protein OsmY